MKSRAIATLLPGVIGSFFLVHGIFYARGIEYGSTSEILTALFIIQISCYGIFFLIYRNGNPLTAVIVSAILVIALFYGDMRDQLFAVPAVSGFVREYFWHKFNAFCLILLSLASWLSLRYCSTSPARSVLATKTLVLFFSLLMCTDVGTYIVRHRAEEIRPASPLEPLLLRGEKPDVYFIIFDSETSPAALQTYWHHDTDSVIATCTRRGMFVARQSRSNYNWTPYSVSSTLAMSYLQNHAAVPTHTEMPPRVEGGIARTFALNGYRLYNLSFFDLDTIPRLGSIVRYSLWARTFFYFVYDRLTNHAYNLFARTQREMLKVTNDSLQSVIEGDTGRPKFIYAHFYLPHPPAFVDENGAALSAGSMESQDMTGYLRQVEYASTLASGIVDRIQARSRGKAIIVLQGDHGYRYLAGPEKFGEQFDVWKAVYFPNGDYSQLTDSTTSVNTFRILLNAEFGTHLPLLPDSTFNVFENMLRGVE